MDVRIPGSSVRTVVALMLREMSTSYGRSALGYVWAFAEPVGGILLLAVFFSLMLQAPALGVSFPLFYASGFVPFMMYLDVSQKLSVALRFSMPLLFYPRVTLLDALLARFFLNAAVQLSVAALVIGAITAFDSVDSSVDITALLQGATMALMLAAGVGTLNCYLLSAFPFWERVWAVLNRPLFLVSGIVFLPDEIALPYRDWLLWNPLVHVIGAFRSGLYVTYDADFVSTEYVLTVSAITGCIGMMLLGLYYRRILMT